MRAFLVGVAGVIGMMTAAAGARADAISGPPACPPGAQGRSAHEGEWCVAWPCESDATCGAGARCTAWRVCTRTSDVVPGGLRPTTPPAEPRELVVGTCAAGAGCRGDEEPPPPTVGTL